MIVSGGISTNKPKLKFLFQIHIHSNSFVTQFLIILMDAHICLEIGKLKAAWKLDSFLKIRDNVQNGLMHFLAPLNSNINFKDCILSSHWGLFIYQKFYFSSFFFAYGSFIIANQCSYSLFSINKWFY